MYILKLVVNIAKFASPKVIPMYIPINTFGEYLPPNPLAKFCARTLFILANRIGDC